MLLSFEIVSGDAQVTGKQKQMQLHGHSIAFLVLRVKRSEVERKTWEKKIFKKSPTES